MLDQNNKKLLVVEQSAAMLHVLKTYCIKHLWDADCFTDSARALAALAARFNRFGSDYSAVVVGWSGKHDAARGQLLEALARVDHHGLPLVILCQQTSADIRSLVATRAATRVLEWGSYQQLQSLIDSDWSGNLASMAPTQDTAAPLRQVLIVDCAPVVCLSIVNQLRGCGHEVELADNFDTARQLMDAQPFDLIAADWQMPGDVDGFVAALRAAGSPTALVSLCEPLSNDAITESIAIGASACFDKNESPLLLGRRLESVMAPPLAVEPVEVVRDEPADPIDIVRAVLDAVTAQLVVVDQEHCVIAVSGGVQARLGLPSDESDVSLWRHRPLKLKQPFDQRASVKLYYADSSPLSFDCIAEPLGVAGLPGAMLLTGVAQPPQTVAVQPAATPVDVPAQPLMLSAAEFSEQLSTLTAQRSDTDSHAALLMIEVQIVAASGDRIDLGCSEPMLNIVRDTLTAQYRSAWRPGYLGEGRFGLLLAPGKPRDAMTATAKLLQMIPEMVRYADNLRLVSHAALLLLDRHDSTATEWLAQCAAACQRSRERGDDLACIIHSNQFLRAGVQHVSANEEPLESQVV